MYLYYRGKNFHFLFTGATIWDLHNHLIDHIEGGNYFYNHSINTAFPKYDYTACTVQTLKNSLLIKAEASPVKDCVEVESSPDEGSVTVKTTNAVVGSVPITGVETTSRYTQTDTTGVDQVKIEDRIIPKTAEDTVSVDWMQYDNNQTTDLKVSVNDDMEQCLNTIPGETAKFHRDNVNNTFGSVISDINEGCIYTEALNIKILKEESRLRNRSRKSNTPIYGNVKIPYKKDNTFARRKKHIKRKKRMYQADIDTTIDESCTVMIDGSLGKAEAGNDHDGIPLGNETCSDISDDPVLEHSEYYSCPACGTQVNSHLLQHDHNYPLQCDNCCSSLHREDISIHNSFQPLADHHVCIKCPDGKTFKYRQRLLKHIEKQHDNELPLVCDVCSKPLVSELDKRRHMSVHSLHVSNTEMYICEKCGNSFKSLAILRGHIRSTCADQQEVYACNLCNRTFRHKSSIAYHMRRHTGEKQFICDICGDDFTHSRTLSNHVKFKHTYEKPHKCSMCDKAFVILATLRRHERVHLRIRQFVCEHCKKEFSTLWNLNAHRRQHTGDTPYKCTKCHLGFAHNVMRKKHEAQCFGIVFQT